MPTHELPHYWTPEQIGQILAAMPAGLPWLFALLLGRSALRQAEVVDLQWRDLNFAAAAPTITVRKGKGAAPAWSRPIRSWWTRSGRCPRAGPTIGIPIF